MDLNSDLGEGFGAWRLGDDNAMLDVVSSANIACGFHAGDPRTLLDTCEQAVKRGVVIGAQVGYRDLAGFGRRFIDYESADLTADLIYQLGRARRPGPGGRRPRPLREAARRALQHDRAPRAAGGGRGRRGPPLRPGPAGAGPARLGVPATWPRTPAW